MQEIADVIYVGKKWITQAMFISWYANILMQKAYKEQDREFSNFYLCLHGSSGIGKTQILKGFTNFHNKLMRETNQPEFFKGGIHKLNLAALAGEDIEIPVADHKSGGVTKLCTIRFGDSPCIVQLDELNRYQSLETVNAITRVILDRDGSQKPPAGSLVVAAANSSSYAGTKEFPEHLITRGIHIYLSEKSQDAIQANVSYMRDNDYPNWMVEAYEMNPTTSQDDFMEIAEYQPRTLEYVKYILEAVDKAELHYKIKTPELLIRALISGCIGSTIASQYLKLRSLEKLPSLGEVLNSPDTALIPDVKLDMALRKKYLNKLIQEVSTVSNSTSSAGKLAKYIGRYSDEFGRDAMENLVKTVPSTTSTPEYKAWLARIPVENDTKAKNGNASANIIKCEADGLFWKIHLDNGEIAICPKFKMDMYHKSSGGNVNPTKCTYNIKDGLPNIQMFS